MIWETVGRSLFEFRSKLPRQLTNSVVVQQSKLSGAGTGLEILVVFGLLRLKNTHLGNLGAAVLIWGTENGFALRIARAVVVEIHLSRICENLDRSVKSGRIV